MFGVQPYNLLRTSNFLKWLSSLYQTRPHSVIAPYTKVPTPFFFLPGSITGAAKPTSRNDLIWFDELILLSSVNSDVRFTVTCARFWLTIGNRTPLQRGNYENKRQYTQMNRENGLTELESRGKYSGKLVQAPPSLLIFPVSDLHRSIS